MSKTVVVTARIDEALAANLDRLCAMRSRSRAWIIERAVAAFVREDLELRDAIREGEEAIERGEFITHDELIADLRARYGQRDAA